MKGGLDVRVAILKDVIRESLRFKRRTLAKLLEDFMHTLVAATNNHNTPLLFRPQNNNGATWLARNLSVRE